jgi:menaquinone-dependent protoporphyrinogen oxidase
VKPVLILYATREGHTQRIADRVAASARARGLSADVLNVATIAPECTLDSYSASIVAASVHRGRHETEMIRFVKSHASDLARLPSAFLSVSLSEAGAEDPAASLEKRKRAAADVEAMIKVFVSETGWHPNKIQPVAGALMYSKYNWLLRFFMKRIARQAGASTDTSKDHEFTDWNALDHVIDELGLPIASDEAVVETRN